MGVLTDIVDSAPGEPGDVGDRLSTGGGEGCPGSLFEERLKDCRTEGGGCGGDGTWPRKKGVHCGGRAQPTPPAEERNPKLLGCRCDKVCPMALVVSPFEPCHKLRVSLSGRTAWSCGRVGAMCSEEGEDAGY
jgi:hypothetical protein